MTEKIYIKPSKKKLVQTLFALKPKKRSLFLSLSFIAFITIISRLCWKLESVYYFLSATQKEVFQDGLLWKPLTTVFVHGDGVHLASNAYMLLFLCLGVLGYFGWKSLFFYGLIGATVTNVISLLTYEPLTRLIGASGLVYYLAGFWLGLFLIVEKQRSLASRILRAFGLGLIILFPTSFEPTTSYRTHFIGLLVGLVFSIFYYRRNKVYIHAFDRFEDISEEEEESSSAFLSH